MNRRPAVGLPAWSAREEVTRLSAVAWPEHVDREWAWGGSSGHGVRVCVVDSGIDGDHPLVSPLEGSVAVTVSEQGEPHVEEDAEGDLCGHGTACASIIRSLASDCLLFSVRVLGVGARGSGKALVAGVRWAVEQGYEVVNMSLSTMHREFESVLHELADSAYFRRTILVASAHNLPVDSYPWRFSSVISVGSHAKPDPLAFFYNPSPPVEFFARGVDVEVASPHGGVLRMSGNSFATPHLSGLCALTLAKHPGLTPFQLKSLLYLTADNVA